jgi:hypothetical protein
MRDAQGDFIAQAVEMQDKDVVLITMRAAPNCGKFSQL